MDFDTAKENIQPLASGRNAEQLETALSAESDHEVQEKLNEQRKEFERAIESYQGEDPLQPWYEYIVWIEQVYPKSGKESALHEMLSKCLSLFEHDERYFQDSRMVKLYIKYIDSEPNPPQFYEQLYNNGIGTMVADLYLCWAHYYDYCDNFEKAEAVYRKGIDARAQPIEALEQAHRQFGFSMSQRILYKDETARQQFRSSMEEQRLALTSLRAHKHRHVGSIRTGAAVRSHNPGRVEQNASSSRQSNRRVQVFEDEAAAPQSPPSSTSVVQSILNSTKKQENMREPGPWNKAKIKSNPLFSGASSSKPAFPILEDDDLGPIPLSEKDNHYIRGIQLPKDFMSKNLPQEEFAFPLHRDEDPAKNTLYRYDKFMAFPAPDKCYSLEEIFAYKWFNQRNIQNNFTRKQDAVWATEYGIPMRLPPHFVRKNAKQDDVPSVKSPINFDDVLGNGQRKFGFNIELLYTKSEEFSPEEILQAKWLNGDLNSQKDNEMEITCGFDRREDIYTRNAKRRSMAVGGRKSILPRKSDSPRKSIARKSIAPPSERVEEEKVPEVPSTSAEASTGAIKRTSLPKRKSVYMPRALDALTTIPETASPPVLRRKLNEEEQSVEPKPMPSKFSIFEDVEGKEPETNNEVFKVPQTLPVPKPRASFAFADDEDGCNTQTFNFFIKSQSISTPKVVKATAKLAGPESAAALRKELDFGTDDDTPPTEEHPGEAAKQPFACREIEQAYLTEPHEIYRQKLSAIMETTEECATISSLATASSKSSSAEEFDFTKNTQSSVAMSTYRHHTMTNNTAKMSSSMASVTNRENESRKMSAFGFEIYQEEPEGDVTLTDQAPAANKSKKPELTVDPDAFDKTLPPAGQFHIYEDDDKADTHQLTAKIDSSRAAMEASAVEKSKHPETSVFDISQTGSAPSAWSSRTLTNQNISLVANSTKTNAEHEPINTSMPIQLPQTKTGFQMLREDTGLTLPTMNFAEERTEQIPQLFNANQTNFTQPMPTQRIEAPSIYMPDIPFGDDTRNMSNMFKANMSIAQPPRAALEQSAVYNKSVFLFPKEDTVTNVFGKQFGDDKTETILNLPDSMQMSVMGAGNLSAFPMIPDMPTLPDIDFEAANAKNMSVLANRTKNKTIVADADKTVANQSVFNGFNEESMLNMNETNVIANQTMNQTANQMANQTANKTATQMANQTMNQVANQTADQTTHQTANHTANQFGRKTLVESNTNELINASAQHIRKTQILSQANPDVTITQNKSILARKPEEKENQNVNLTKSSFIVNKSVANDVKSKVNIDDEFCAMITSPQKPVEMSLAMSTMEKSKITIELDKSRAIDEEMYAKVLPTTSPDNAQAVVNKTALSKSKTAIDDEFYANISPVKNRELTLATSMFVIDTPSPAAPSIRPSVIPEPKSIVHQLSQMRDPSLSLLEPMKQASICEAALSTTRNVLSSGRTSIVEVDKVFCDDNPHTAMFALHMPSIQNSTILGISKEHVDEPKNCEISKSVKDKSVAMILDCSVKQDEEVNPNLSGLSERTYSEVLMAANKATDLNLESIHIKEERLSNSIQTNPSIQAVQTAAASKPVSNIDDEMYEMIKEKDTPICNFLDLSIEFTEVEMAMYAKQSAPVKDPIPNIVISNPVSIRPSQFPMNESKMDKTVAKDEVTDVEQSFKECRLSSLKGDRQTMLKPADESVIVVEPTEDLSNVCRALDRTRRETVHSPFKNRYAANPRLNETISAVKEIDPFDIHLQNAFLDDIDFIEYIKNLENVHITTRVKAIEVNTKLDMGNEQFHIMKQIGKGSFGFVYGGKSMTTGKMYAFKQERPANYWEFYISLEVSSRIENTNILPGFMCVEHAMVGHNSSIFASELCKYGSLFDVCNHHKLNTARSLDEVIAMIFSEQMLSILDHLHASNIIHGDIKPDNFLLMKRLSYGKNELVIKLIDYGQSIDLNFFPPNQTFSSILNTKNFICTEMLEGRPWKHQVDLFCLASSMYPLVCGKYMNIKKNPDSNIRPYVLSEELAPYLNVKLWEHVFYSLINVRDHNTLPDLQKLRLRICEALVENEHLIEDKVSKFNAVLELPRDNQC